MASGRWLRRRSITDSASIIIGVGGSASTDGGEGFPTALGAAVREQYGTRLDPSGATIGSAANPDLTGLRSQSAVNAREAIRYAITAPIAERVDSSASGHRCP